MIAKKFVIKTVLLLAIVLNYISFCYADSAVSFNSNANKAYIGASDGYANVRKGAGSNFEIVGKIENGTRIDTYGSIKNNKNEKWYYITYSENNEKLSGWTHDSNISFDYKKFETEELIEGEEKHYLQEGSEIIGFIVDSETKKEKYLYKTLYVENTITHVDEPKAIKDAFKFQTDIDDYESKGITELYDEDEYDKYMSITSFYDFNGNEIDIKVTNLSSIELYKNFLIFTDYEGAKSYDITNKKTINLGDKYNTIAITDKEIVLSLIDWWQKSKLCFYSLDLNKKFEFDGYKYNKEIDINGKKYKIIYRDIVSEFTRSESGVYVFSNLLDENYNKVFNEDVYVVTRNSKDKNYDEYDKSDYIKLLKSRNGKLGKTTKKLEFDFDDVDKIYKINDDDYNFCVCNEKGYAIFSKDKTRISDYFKYDIERVHSSDKQEFNVYLTANDKKERVYFRLVDGKTDIFFTSLKKLLDFSDYNYYIEYYFNLYTGYYDENDKRSKYKLEDVNCFTPTIIHNLDKNINDIEISSYCSSLDKVYIFAGKPYFLLNEWYGTSVWIKNLYDSEGTEFARDARVIYNDDVIIIRDKFGDSIYSCFYDKNMNYITREYGKEYTKIYGYSNKVFRLDYQRTYSDWYDKEFNLKYEYQMHERSGFSGPIGTSGGKTYYYVQRSNDNRVNLNGKIEGRIIDDDFKEYKTYNQQVFNIYNMKKGNKINYLVDLGKGNGYEILDIKFKTIKKSETDLSEEEKSEIFKKYKDK